TGGAIGVATSGWSTRALAMISGRSLPRVEENRNDGMVVAVSAATALLTGILFGLAPALQASRADLNAGLRDESRGTTGKGRNRLRAALVVAQVALAVILLIGSGLLMR